MKSNETGGISALLVADVRGVQEAPELRLL